ncbi:metal-dependent hydrolase [Conexibacter woesei]|uniref:metal-dependent hydrolase n=1 Tax=Conexibacter woesei TaxID=191495 RepID=UPI000414FFE4|nr:metal-dependent hydrolase [Conexibacter woesei]
MPKITFLGHAAFSIEHDGRTVLIDPFLTGNPKAAAKADEVAADAIFLTHGHGDHLGDTVDIAKRTGATVVAIVELADELSKSVDNVKDPNIGGTVDLGWVSVRLTPAWHTGTSPSGTASTPAGLVIEIGGKRIYHLGDTGLFSDLALPSKRGHIDVAIVPIGGHYTMDRFDAVVAADFLKADQIIPCHYDTFPPIETDAEAYKKDVQDAGYAEVIVLEPGAAHDVR